MQSPWFLKGELSARTRVFQPSFLHWSLFVATFPPMQGPLRLAETSQGVKVTPVLTLSPVPEPIRPGPLAAPHQLHVPLTKPPELGSLKIPKSVFPVSEFLWAWVVPVTEFAVTFTPYALLYSVLPVIVTVEFTPSPKALATLTAD